MRSGEANTLSASENILRLGSATVGGLNLTAHRVTPLPPTIPIVEAMSIGGERAAEVAAGEALNNGVDHRRARIHKLILDPEVRGLFGIIFLGVAW